MSCSRRCSGIAVCSAELLSPAKLAKRTRPRGGTLWQMSRTLSVLLGFGLATGLAAAASSKSGRAAGSAFACQATQVRGDYVHAGPFAGGIDRDYDIVNGGFRLHVGPWRNRSIGLTQKIPWFLPGKYRVGVYLVVRGRRLAPTRGAFTVRLPEAGGPDPKQHVFPSTLSPPGAGCWRLTFQTGLVQGRLTVRVTR
jgi:hypothetical protein